MLVSFREGIPQISDHLLQVKANMKQMKQFTTYRHPKTRQATWSHTSANKRGINLLPLPMVLHTICANDDSWELHGRMASWEGDTCNRYKSELVVEPTHLKKYATVKLGEHLPQRGMKMKKMKPPPSKYIVYTCSTCCLMLHIQHMRKNKLKWFLFQQATLLLHFLLAVLDKPNIPNVSEGPGNLHISPSTAVLVVFSECGVVYSYNYLYVAKVTTQRYHTKIYGELSR